MLFHLYSSLFFDLSDSGSKLGESIFDWQFYSKTYSVDVMSRQAAWFHYIRYGLQEGHLSHSGHKVMKVVLMTKNEWPLIKSWVLYHGHLLGFENLYIIDGSTDEKVIQFLKESVANVGVNVYFSTANLVGLTKEINKAFFRLRHTCDFLIKLDTDEFLSIYNATGDHSISIDRENFASYLDSLPYDGHKYRVTYTALNRLNESTFHCSNVSNVCIDSVNFGNMFVWSLMGKTFFPSWTFKSVDLGGHVGKVTVDSPWSSTSVPKFLRRKDVEYPTHLAVLHFHNLCFERYLKEIVTVLLSENYIQENQTSEERIAAIKEVQSCRECKHPSHHKYEWYLRYLNNPRGTQKEYELSITASSDTEGLHFPDLSVLVQQLQIEYDKTYKDMYNT